MKEKQFNHLENLKLIVFCFAVAVVMGLRPVSDPDIWWHLANGRSILQNFSIPAFDAFSYTAFGKPWFQHEWGAGVLFWIVYSLLGIPGLILFEVALFSGTLYLAAKTCGLLTVSKRAPFVVVFLLSFLSVHRLQPRPHLLTTLFIAVELFILYRHFFNWKKFSKELFLIPFMVVLWANLHGGVILGIGLLYFFLAGSIFEGIRKTGRFCLNRELVFVVILSSLAGLINPHFFRIYLFPFENLGMTVAVRATLEWQSPFALPWRSMIVFQAYMLLLVVTLVMVIVRRPLLQSQLLFLGIPLLFLSVRYNRYTDLFALWSLPWICSEFSGLCQDWMKRFKQTRRGQSLLLRTLVVSLFGFFVLLSAILLVRQGLPEGETLKNLKFQVGFGSDPQFAPNEALTYMERNNFKEKRIYNDFSFGGYLIFRGFPVFIDGRADVYRDELFQKYINSLLSIEHFEEEWRQWGFQVVFLSQNQLSQSEDLRDYLLNSQKWVLAYADDVAVIFVDRRELL